MKHSDDLHKLIHSLNKAEKRSFRLSASRYAGNKNYLKLFDAIDKQKAYSEEKLLLLFAKEKFGRHLHRYKNYLYNLILQSLETQFAGDTSDSVLKHKLLRISILFKKSLYEQCEKLIENANEFARKRGNHPALLELSNWKLRTIGQLTNSQENETFITELFRNESDLFVQYENSRKYTEMERRLFAMFRKEGMTRNRNYLKQLDKFISNPLLTDEKKATCVPAKIKFHSIHIAICAISHNYNKLIIHSKRIVELMDSNPFLIEENKANYINSLANHFNTQISLKQFDDAAETLEKIKKVRVVRQVDKDMQLEMSIDKELMLALNTGEFEKGRALLNSKSGEQYENLAVVYKREAEAFMKIVNIYFVLGDFQKAKAYSKMIIHASQSHHRKDIESFARIILLIIYYETGDIDQLERSIRSVYRFLLKLDRLFKLESAIMKFIRKKIINLNTQEERRNAFIELKDQLEKITRDPFEGTALEYFDFISWLESKIENRTFAEIIRKKAIQKNT